MFVTPGKTATCQVSIEVTRKALTAQKALMSTMPKGAYSISHKTIDGSPALAFSQYSSNVQSPDDKFNSASTKKAVVAQPNTSHGVNLYTLSLGMFRAAFVRSKNTEPHTACESDFEVMTNSLVLVNVVPGVLTDPNNPAIQFAEAYWKFTSYDQTAGLYCSLQQRYTGAYTTAQCGDHVNNKKVLVPDNYYYQPVYECAEFVARALANEGYISFDPYKFPAVSS